MKEFFRNELQNIKTSIIEGVKEDIIKIVDHKISISQNTVQNDQDENT